MANEEQLKRLRQGVDGWNQWRKENSEVQIDLIGADLSKADLRGVNLSGAQLRGAQLIATTLNIVNLSKADLRGVNLSGAQLLSANLFEAMLLAADLSRANLTGADLRGTNLHEAKLLVTDLSGADLSEADLHEANLCEAKLLAANLFRTNLCEANLFEAEMLGAQLREAQLIKAQLVKAKLFAADLHRANLSGARLFAANLSEANLSGTELIGADLREAQLFESRLLGADLSKANLFEADLCGANLKRTQMLGTCFEGASLTGACIEDWNINSETRFNRVVCDYIYLKANQQECRPREGNFKPGEFAALFQQAVDTVDLIFRDGIDWQAFFQSFQDLRSQYVNQDISIQGIEKKRGGAFVVRLEVPPEVDKTVIESRAKELYASEVKALEAQYEERLRLQGQHLEDARQTIEVERRDKASLMAVMSTMGSTQQGPKYVLNQPQFGGGLADIVQGNQDGGTINNVAAETLSLAEAAAEIENLLKQLEASNPTATETDQIAFLNIMIPPTRRERFIGALRTAGGDAIEEVPYGSVLKALVEGWQNPNG